MKTISLTLFLSIGLLFVAAVSTFAQHSQAATAAIPPAVPVMAKDLDDAVSRMKQMDAAKGGSETVPTFDVKDLATLSGRIVSDTNKTNSGDAHEPSPFVDVKIILRSIDTHFENLVREELTDDNGTYSFEYLVPGKYTVEIDNETLPAAFHDFGTSVAVVDVTAGQSAHSDLQVKPQRSVSGTVYIDKNRDAKFKPGKDKTVAGAIITVEGHVAVSDANGAFEITGLPSGRVGLLVSSPKSDENTHIILDLGTGPVNNRVVNVPVDR